VRKREGRDGKEGGERRKEEDPQCLKFVDANVQEHGCKKCFYVFIKV